jgi:hypothetical protein
MPHQVVPIEGNLVRTWRESIRGKNKSLLFRRERIWNVDDMTERCITLFRESRVDQRLHWCGHFFNYRLKRMRGNGGKRRFLLDKGGGGVRENIALVEPPRLSKEKWCEEKSQMPQNLKGSWVSPTLLVSWQ